MPIQVNVDDAPIAITISGAQGPAGPAGATTWAGITDKPATFPPIIGPGADEAVAGNDARLSGPLELDAAPVDGAAESITSLNTLTEEYESTTCPTLYRQVDLVNGKPMYVSDGYYVEFPVQYGWKCYWSGSEWVVEYHSVGSIWYYASSSENVATPDLVIAWNNAFGIGAPDFSLAPSVAGTQADYLGQPAIVTIGDEKATYLCTQLDPVQWDGPLGNEAISSTDISDSTAAGRAILTAADDVAQRAAMGLGTLATQSGTFSGASSGTNTGDQTITLTGDVTGSGTGSFAATLATVNANVGTFGSATQSPAFTVDGKGRVTAASATTITPNVNSITGLGSGIANFLILPSSAQLAAAVTDENGSGKLIFSAGTLNIAFGKTATFNNSVTWNGTDSTTMTLPSTSASLARTDAGQTFAGANTFSGQQELTGQAATNGTSAMTRDLCDTRYLGASDNVMTIPCAGWASNTTGSGAYTAGGPGAFRITSGTTTGSTVLARANSGNTFVFGRAGASTQFDQFPWSSRLQARIRFGLTTPDANTILRFQIGEAFTKTTVGDLDAKGIGFKISNTSLVALAHNGTTLTTSSTLATVSSSYAYEIILDSDGAGNLTITLNGTVIGTMSGAPTSVGSTGYTAVNFSITNGAGTQSSSGHLSQLQIYIP